MDRLCRFALYYPGKQEGGGSPTRSLHAAEPAERGEGKEEKGILFDNFIMDDARVFPEPRYQLHPVFTKSGHAFVGPGHLDIAGLLTNEATNIMRLWDTDTANVDATQAFVVELDIDGNFTTNGRLYFGTGTIDVAPAKTAQFNGN